MWVEMPAFGGFFFVVIPLVEPKGYLKALDITVVPCSPSSPLCKIWDFP